MAEGMGDNSNGEKRDESGPKDDQTDAKSWFNFGNRFTNHSANYGELRIHEDSIEYDMKHKNFGKCLIFNHENYKDNIQDPRRGSSADANSLYDCFRKIGFDVTLKNDLEAKAIFDLISKVSKEDHTDNDCLVCCILTHGHNEMLWAFDTLYALDDIISFFTGDKCKTLAGKPKIFLIQACRGFTVDDGVEVRVTSDVTDSKGSKIVKIPVFTDFLVAYSSMSGFYSFRNIVDGSWFINHLTQVFNQYHKQYDLLSMLTIVNQRVAYQNVSKSVNPDFNDKKQVPCVTHTLTRKVFFAPKESYVRSTYL